MQYDGFFLWALRSPSCLQWLWAQGLCTWKWNPPREGEGRRSPNMTLDWWQNLFRNQSGKMRSWADSFHDSAQRRVRPPCCPHPLPGSRCAPHEMTAGPLGGQSALGQSVEGVWAVDTTEHRVSGLFDWIQVWETGSSVQSTSASRGPKPPSISLLEVSRDHRPHCAGWHNPSVWKCIRNILMGCVEMNQPATSTADVLRWDRCTFQGELAKVNWSAFLCVFLHVTAVSPLSPQVLLSS